MGTAEVPSYEHFGQLKYAQATFSEVLRLKVSVLLWRGEDSGATVTDTDADRIPPNQANVPLNFKVPTHDDVLPGTGTKVYQGQRIMFAPYVSHRLC